MPAGRNQPCRPSAAKKFHVSALQLQQQKPSPQTVPRRSVRHGTMSLPNRQPHAASRPTTLRDTLAARVAALLSTLGEGAQGGTSAGATALVLRGRMICPPAEFPIRAHCGTANFTNWAVTPATPNTTGATIARHPACAVHKRPSAVPACSTPAQIASLPGPKATLRARSVARPGTLMRERLV